MVAARTRNSHSSLPRQGGRGLVSQAQARSQAPRDRWTGLLSARSRETDKGQGELHAPNMNTTMNEARSAQIRLGKAVTSGAASRGLQRGLRLLASALTLIADALGITAARC